MSYLLTTKNPPANTRLSTETAIAFEAYRADVKKLTGVDISISAGLNALTREALKTRGYITAPVNK